MPLVVVYKPKHKYVRLTCMLSIDSWEISESQIESRTHKEIGEEEGGESAVSCQRILRGKRFVTFNKYSLIAFVLQVEDTAKKKVSKVHDLWDKQTFN